MELPLVVLMQGPVQIHEYDVSIEKDTVLSDTSGVFIYLSIIFFRV